MAALKAAGCERIYREKASGGRWDRPELHRLLDQLRKGDVLVVWKLDRLSRSLRDVLTIMERLDEARCGLHDKEAVRAISRNQTCPADEEGQANLTHEMGSSRFCSARDRRSSINSNGSTRCENMR